MEDDKLKELINDHIRFIYGLPSSKGLIVNSDFNADAFLNEFIEFSAYVNVEKGTTYNNSMEVHDLITTVGVNMFQAGVAYGRKSKMTEEKEVR